jgi:hypothetical protein
VGLYITIQLPNWKSLKLCWAAAAVSKVVGLYITIHLPNSKGLEAVLGSGGGLKGMGGGGGLEGSGVVCNYTTPEFEKS